MSMFMGPTITISFPRHEQISCGIIQKYHTSVIQGICITTFQDPGVKKGGTRGRSIHA